MDNLSCPQEADGVRHIGIPDCSEDVIVGRPGLLFRSHVFCKICDDIALGLELAGIERNAPGGLRPERRGMVDIIGAEAGVLNFFHGQVFGELIDDGADHFEMSEFFCGNICQKSRYLAIRHGIALGQITHGSAQLAVRTAILGNDELCQFGVWFLDVNGKLQSFFIIPHSIAPPFPGKGSKSPFPFLAAGFGRRNCQRIIFCRVFRRHLVQHTVVVAEIAQGIPVIRVGVQIFCQLNHDKTDDADVAEAAFLLLIHTVLVLTVTIRAISTVHLTHLLPVKGLFSSGKMVPQQNASSRFSKIPVIRCQGT